MSANPLLDINPMASEQSNNPLLSIAPTQQAVQSANQAAAPYAAPFLAGAGQQLANIGHNAAGLAASGLDASGLTQNSANNVNNYFANNVDNFYKPIMAQNPNAAYGGQIAGAIIGTAPTLASSPLKAVQAGTGFANGYFNSDPNAPMTEKLVNGAGGAALNMVPGGVAAATTIGAAGGYGYGYATGGNAGKDALIGAGTALASYAGGKGALNTVRGLKAAITTPTDLANIATQKTLDAVGGDMSKATPEDFFKQVDNLTNAAKTQKDALYTARDVQAAKEGVGVLRVNLGMLTDNLENQVKQGATSDVKSALSEAKNLLGNGDTISYAKAQGLVKSIGSTINSANNKRDFAQAENLRPVRDALLRDIQGAAGSDTLQTMKVDADNFYKNIYAPLRGVGTRNMFDPNLAQKYSNDFYLSNALNAATTNAKLHSAFDYANQQGLDNNAMQMMQAAHVNALKEASSLGGQINPKTYADSLAQTLKKNPTPFAPIADNLQALGNALEVAKQVGKVRATGTEHSLGQKIGMGLMTSAVGGGATYYGTGDLGESAKVAAGAYFIPKAIYMYGAGRMLQNPTTRALLSRAATLSDQAPPETKAALSSMIAKKFQQQVQTIPSRLLPVFDSSNNPQQQQ